MPKVSVIIPTYSRPDLLPRAVESAKKAGTDVEVIVVDDASKDETAEVCKNLRGIKYIRLERNQHTAGARNIGIMASSAPYVALLDDDDWRLPGTLDSQVSLLEENPQAGMVYAQVLTADQQGNVADKPSPAAESMPDGDIFWDVLNHNFTAPQSLVIRRECFERVGLFDAHLSGIDDWDMCIRIAEIFPVLAFKKPVAVWRSPTGDSGQGTSNLSKLLILGAKTLNSKWSKLPRFAAAPESEKRAARRRFAKKIGRWAIDDIYYTKDNIDSLKRFIMFTRYFPSSFADSYFYKVMIKKLISSK